MSVVRYDESRDLVFWQTDSEGFTINILNKADVDCWLQMPQHGLDIQPRSVAEVVLDNRPVFIDYPNELCPHYVAHNSENRTKSLITGIGFPLRTEPLLDCDGNLSNRDRRILGIGCVINEASGSHSANQAKPPKLSQILTRCSLLEPVGRINRNPDIKTISSLANTAEQAPSLGIRQLPAQLPGLNHGRRNLPWNTYCNKCSR